MSTCYDRTGLTPDEAVEEVVRLRAVVSDLLAALEYFADQIDQFKPYHVTSLGLDYAMQQANIAIRQARGI